MSPKVSVLLPTFNRAHIICGAIESIQKQTFSDWELIVMDDGSKDNTREVINRLMETDLRIRYVYKENEGLSATRAKAVGHARGEYITLIDDDDFYLPCKLELQAKYLDENPDAGLVYSYVDQVDGNKTFVRKLPVEPARDFYDLANECTVQTASVMIRKKCFEEIGTFRTDLRGIDDYEMWLRISRSYKIGFLPETVALYVRHQNNMGSNAQLRYDSLMDLYRLLLSWNLTSREKSRVLQTCALRSYWHASLCLDQGKYSEAARLFARALRYRPLIGSSISWARYGNPVYKVLKPYLAAAFCAGKSVSLQLKPKALDGRSKS